MDKREKVRKTFGESKFLVLNGMEMHSHPKILRDDGQQSTNSNELESSFPDPWLLYIYEKNY